MMHDGARAPAASLGDLLEGASLAQQLLGMIGRRRAALLGLGWVRAAAERVQYTEDLLTEALRFSLSDSGNVQQFVVIGGTLAAQVFDRRVVKDDVRGHLLLACRLVSPLSKKGKQLRIAGLGCPGRRDRALHCLRDLDRLQLEDLQFAAAYIAHGARVPFRSLTEMETDLAMTAGGGFDEVADGPVAVPAALPFVP